MNILRNLESVLEYIYKVLLKKKKRTYLQHKYNIYYLIKY